MRAIAFVNQGLEQVASEEIKEKIGCITKEFHPGIIIIECEKYEDICKLSYGSQSLNHIFYYVEEFKSTTEITQEYLEKKSADKQLRTTIAALYEPCTTYRIKCKNFSSKDIDYGETESEIGEQLAIPLKVDLNHPDIIFTVLLFDTKAILCIDFSGDISKRSYKLFNTPQSLKGPTGFGFYKLAETKPKDIVLDPYCNSGVLVIEAALAENKKSPQFYQKKFPFMRLAICNDWDTFFQKIDKSATDNKCNITASDELITHMNAAKKNAKIAGVEKHIDFRRIEINWLELKFEDESIDKIITFIAGSSKTRDVEKRYARFFEQADIILKKQGKVIILCLTKSLLIAQAAQYFKITKESTIQSGEQTMYVLFFERVNAQKVASRSKKVQNEQE